MLDQFRFPNPWVSNPLSPMPITVSIHFQFHLSQNIPDTEYICMPNDFTTKGWNVFLKAKVPKMLKNKVS